MKNKSKENSEESLAESAINKDSETRIKSFTEINSKLSKYAFPRQSMTDAHVREEIESDPVETFGTWIQIANAAKKGIKRGGNEGILSADCISLLCISVEDGREEYRSEFVSTLKSVILDTSIDAKTRSNACRALSNVILFTPFNHKEEDVQIFEFIRKEVRNESQESIDSVFQTGLLESYLLLLTRLDDNYIHENVITSDTEVLESLLHSNDENVALASGIALAYFFQVGRKILKDNFDFFKFTRYAHDELQASELKSTLHSLRSKKGDQKRRISFGDIYNSIVEGKIEVEEMRVVDAESSIVKFSEWKEFIILDEMRRITEVDCQFTKNSYFRERVLEKKDPKWKNPTPDVSVESKKRDKEIRYDREAKSKGLG
eukprot:TRINITY_DN3052_c0_g1_i1.p1 TRINITY_DN3052_c0_g1~~TRINITY_DN3052_c0_g1_i1.p1  ORF type:complete len:376 (+),score=159.19 TRINITY_DN3052_c0_g1_i1:182-1309(+)